MSVHAIHAVHAVHPEPQPVVVDLAPVLLRVAASAQAVARARRVLLSVEVESGPLHVPGGWHDVDDALLDVVGQAVSSCQAGAAVAIDVHREGGGVAVDVTDTGQGTGTTWVDPLVARHLLHACGGRLSLARVDGVGTTVQLWWPAAGRQPAAGGAAGNGRLVAVV